MHYHYFRQALAVLALWHLAACAEADLSGSNATLARARNQVITQTETSTATSTTTSHAATPPPNEVPSSQEPQNGDHGPQEGFDTDVLAALHAVDISAETVAAPTVKLSKLEEFNQALYLSLECEHAAADNGQCVPATPEDPSYALTDLQVFLTLADAAKPVETTFDKSELLALTNPLVPAESQGDTGHVDYGPISLPEGGADQVLVIIVRYIPIDLGPEFASYKVFIADTWEDLP